MLGTVPPADCRPDKNMWWCGVSRSSASAETTPTCDWLRRPSFFFWMRRTVQETPKKGAPTRC